MRPRDTVGGFAVFAFSRACARKTTWLRDFASASSWLARPMGLDLGPWQGSVFGAGLAELTRFAPTGDGDEASAAGSAPARPDTRADARWGGDRSAASKPAPSRARPGAAAPPHAATGRSGARATAAVASPGATTRMPDARLAALAAGSARPPFAPQAESARRRQPATEPVAASAGIRPAGPSSRAAAIARPAFVTPADAPARLRSTLARRIAQTFARAAGRAPWGEHPSSGAAWEDFLNAPEPGLRLVPPPDAAPAKPERARQNSNHPVAGPATLQPPPRASAAEAASPQRRLEAVRPGAPDRRPRPSQQNNKAPGGAETKESLAFPNLPAAHRQPFAPAPAPADAAPPDHSRTRLDPFEFAERFRDTLLADARRHGIDV